MLLHIGMDDSDSPAGGCTTYVSAVLVERLRGLGASFVDYPNLVRLNPNVPWKTRGNGAICLRIEVDPRAEGAVKRAVLDAVEGLSYLDCVDTNPGVVFHIGEIPGPLERFTERAIQDVVTREEAEAVAHEVGSHAIGYSNMRGIIGALAAAGWRGEGDHTFELLAYRTPENRGGRRRVDAASVVEMDAATRGATFSNLDPETGRILVTPRGPDPVLMGIRGESAEAVHKAGMMVRVLEPIERWVTFRTNQGTDAHLGRIRASSDLGLHRPAVVRGEVAGRPRTIPGGHVIFALRDEAGQVDCAAYEPTGGFRQVVRRLISGDVVKAYGGVAEPVGVGRRTLNLEKLEILGLRSDVRLANPSCPGCGASMESMGRGKGHRCRKCGLRRPDLGKRAVELERGVAPGLYIPPPRARRHLTKPPERYGKEQKGYVPRELYTPWHGP